MFNPKPDGSGTTERRSAMNPDKSTTNAKNIFSGKLGDGIKFNVSSIRSCHADASEAEKRNWRRLFSDLNSEKEISASELKTDSAGREIYYMKDGGYNSIFQAYKVLSFDG